MALRIFVGARSTWERLYETNSGWSVDQAVRWALYDAPEATRKVILHDEQKREYAVLVPAVGRILTVVARKAEGGGWEAVRRAYLVLPS